MHIFEYPTDLACSWKTPCRFAETNLMLQHCCFPGHDSPCHKVECSSGSLYTTVLPPDSSAWLQENLKMLQKRRLISRANLYTIWHKVTVTKDIDSKG